MEALASRRSVLYTLFYFDAAVLCSGSKLYNNWWLDKCSSILKYDGVGIQYLASSRTGLELEDTSRTNSGGLGLGILALALTSKAPCEFGTIPPSPYPFTSPLGHFPPSTLLFSIFYFSLFHFFPSHLTRITRLRFQAGCRRRRQNLSLVCVCVLILCCMYFLSEGCMLVFVVIDLVLSCGVSCLPLL